MRVTVERTEKMRREKDRERRSRRWKIKEESFSKPVLTQPPASARVCVCVDKARRKSV